MNGVLELAKDVEIALESISKEEKIAILEKNHIINLSKTNNHKNQKERLRKLQKLMIKYPHSPLIYESMDALLNMDATDDIIEPWLNSIDDFVALLDTKSGI